MLKMVEPGEQASCLHQIRQRAAFPYLTFFEDDNLVRAFDCRQPVGDHNHGPVLAQFVQGFLNPLLGDAV